MYVLICLIIPYLYVHMYIHLHKSMPSNVILKNVYCEVISRQNAKKGRFWVKHSVLRKELPPSNSLIVCDVISY